eukprot:gnl/TRDRNA2_/TRDRNA2_76255_c0_seq1.p1 gnl/TRDRNA2_/TRDRNA2_76255_c0~~gnl/TRDRNA2_/TRDRNA2_76255_c0_seq1.p1  ORF type:complete len:156 (-),score=25.09 gnl/TRDRNA2_/TRDRNA2_76255_c0_seq1:58-489(-)
MYIAVKKKESYFSKFKLDSIGIPTRKMMEDFMNLYGGPGSELMAQLDSIREGEGWIGGAQIIREGVNAAMGRPLFEKIVKPFAADFCIKMPTRAQDANASVEKDKTDIMAHIKPNIDDVNKKINEQHVELITRGFTLRMLAKP